jgi:hypothetical protein
MPHSFCETGFYALKGHRHKAQGWPRFLRPTLGGRTHHNQPCKGCALILCATLTGLIYRAFIPRVERHKTPLNPGLCADAPLGHLRVKNIAALNVPPDKKYRAGGTPALPVNPTCKKKPRKSNRIYCSSGAGNS